MKFNPTTPLKYYAQASTYTSGQGQDATWILLSSGDISTFYADWQGAYGERATTAESLGVKDSATIRTFYIPAVYEKLRSVRVLVVKNADALAVVDGVPDRNNANLYELWGGVDNVREENQFMEFRVRRYEAL